MDRAVRDAATASPVRGTGARGSAASAKHSEAWRRSARCWTVPPGLPMVGAGANQVLSGETTRSRATKMAVYTSYTPCLLGVDARCRS